MARRMIGIVSASGGLTGIPAILSSLPNGFDTPIILYQSMPDEFIEEFASRLAERTALPVRVAQDGMPIGAGGVYLKGVGLIRVDGGRLRIHRRSDESSMDLRSQLFRSIAEEVGVGAIAVILSGLSSDGAAGMLAVREAGGHTIAQDEATSAVYGMPRHACEAGAVCESLPIDRIGPRLVELTQAAPCEGNG